MTHRQAALFGGASALLLVIALAGTATVIARRDAPEAPLATTSTPALAEVATSTLATTTTSTSPKGPVPIGARAFIAGDLGTGQVISSRRSTEVRPLASLTKLMTAIIALREIPADTPVLIVPVPGGNPSRPGIPVGETFAMQDVLAVMLISSSNEAAESLAAHVGREKFVSLMNAQARDWGLAETVYEDPSGLSARNRSTAREMFEVALRVNAAAPTVFQTTRRGAISVNALGTGVAYTAVATHELVRDPGFLGGKTGYTDQARGNLLSLFQVGPRAEALIVLGSDDRSGDTRRLLATLKEQ